MNPITRHLLTASRTATARGIVNSPNAAQCANLERLWAEMEKIATLTGVAWVHDTDPRKDALYFANIGYMAIACAYRCPVLNRAVGGDPASAHLEGRAVDFQPGPGYTHDQLQHAIADNPNIATDKIIEEFSADGARWLHFQVAPFGAAPRRLVRDLALDHVGGTIVRTVAG